MTNGVLPGGELLPVVREPLHYELTDTTQSQLLLFRLQEMAKQIIVNFV